MNGKTMAEVLTEHAFHQILPVDIDQVNGPWQVECNCTADPIQGPSFLAAKEAFAAHQAMELANAGFGDVREARAGALEDAGNAPLPAPGRKGETSGFRFWLRARAQTLRATR